MLASTTGDIATAVAVAQAVDQGRSVPPLLFYQSNANAVVGYVAARWGLAGPVVCTIPASDGLTDALEVATLLIEGGNAALRSSSSRTSGSRTVTPGPRCS